MSSIINQTYIALNINGKPIKSKLIESELLLEKTDLITDDNIGIIAEIDNLKTLVLKTSRFLIDFNKLMKTDLSVFENCILFISNFSFSKEAIFDRLKEKGNNIQIISEIDSTKNFIKNLEYCRKNGIGLIIDTQVLSNVNWDEYIVESEYLGILYKSNFSPSTADNKLKEIRVQIEACDKLIYEQFAIRMSLIEEIVQLKKSNLTEAYQPSKFIENILSLINNKNINEENKMDVIKLYQTLHDMAVERQKRII